jgi:signal transduction histidine kinase/CheY-like chemotaxis protein
MNTTYSSQEKDVSGELVWWKQETLFFLILFIGLLSYLWLAWALLPLNYTPAIGMVGLITLCTSTLVAFLLRHRNLTLATQVLVWGGVIAITSINLVLHISIYTLLFILPFIVINALLDGRSVIAVTVSIFVLVLVVNQVHHENPIPSLVLLSIGVGTTQIAIRHLKVTLDIIWQNYIKVYQDQQLLRDKQGELRHVVKQLDEATYEAGRLRRQLTIAYNQAYTASLLKQQFAQAVSHELRTPLHIIVGFARLMTESPEHYGAELPFSYRRDLNLLYRNAQHLQSLVNDVLDLARIQAAHMTITPQETDPTLLVKDATETIRTLVDAKGLVLQLHVEPDLPVIWVDEVRIRQVLFNLLSNAIRFTDTGEINISVSRREDHIIFEVADTGIGISTDDMKKIFDMFHQQQGEHRGGTGLGLTISKQFVELHGGKIWAESERHKGSIFRFKLPIMPQHLDHSSVELATDGPNTIMTTNQNERILLLVTSSPASASLLARYLPECRTIVAQDLQQAMKTAKHAKPDLIAIDTASIDIDAQQLQNIATYWDLPNVLVMACPLHADSPIPQAPGIDGYLVKPFERDRLWTVLRQYGADIDTVLVIDDNHDFVRLFSRMLDHPLRRYQVLTAYGGQEGLDLLALHKPDLIFVDLDMPHMNGFEVINRIRADSRFRDLPVIVVSGQDGPEQSEALTGTIQLARESGFRLNDILHFMHILLDSEMKGTPQRA